MAGTAARTSIAVRARFSAVIDAAEGVPAAALGPLRGWAGGALGGGTLGFAALGGAAALGAAIAVDPCLSTALVTRSSVALRLLCRSGGWTGSRFFGSSAGGRLFGSGPSGWAGGWTSGRSGAGTSSWSGAWAGSGTGAWAGSGTSAGTSTRSPGSACVTGTPVDVDVAIDIDVAVVGDVVTPPVEGIADRCAHEHTGEKSGSGGIIDRVGRGVMDYGCAGLDHDYTWLVRGYVDDFGIGRCDLDDFPGFARFTLDHLRHHDLLLVAFQVADPIGLGAELLDCLHDVLLLIVHGRTQLLSPIEIVVHHADDLRVVEQPQHTGIPFLIGLQIGLFLAFFQKARGLNDL